MRTAAAIRLVAYVLLAAVGFASEPYDFRTSDAYAGLSEQDRARLEQVHRDFMMLWGAVDRYADDHDGKAPETLDQLAPAYLGELPRDPFATAATSAETPAHCTLSKGGWGYRYRRGPMVGVLGRTENRSWVLSSVGLHGFPYLAERDNVGLYVCKGVWL